MILASLLAAYCSEYRAARASRHGPRVFSPDRAAAAAGRLGPPGSVRVQLRARGPPGPHRPSAGPGGRSGASRPAPPLSLPPPTPGRARAPGPGWRARPYAAMPATARRTAAHRPRPTIRAEPAASWPSRALQRRRVPGRARWRAARGGGRTLPGLSAGDTQLGNVVGDAAADSKRGARGGSGARGWDQRGWSCWLAGKQTQPALSQKQESEGGVPTAAGISQVASGDRTG